MNARHLSLALITAGFTAAVFAADEETAKKPARNEAMRAQMIEDAKKQAAAAPTAAPATTAASKASPPANPIIANTAEKAPPTAPAAPVTSAAATKPADEPATVLPKVEVNRSKLHPLARELYEKEKEISREKQLTKPTELDKALNDPKVTLPLFGGQSTASRASIASERTALLEAEADLIEEIGRAKTKEQKAELRKQLDELKKVRRDLEHAIR